MVRDIESYSSETKVSLGLTKLNKATSSTTPLSLRGSCVVFPVTTRTFFRDRFNNDLILGVLYVIILGVLLHEKERGGVEKKKPFVITGRIPSRN